MIFAVITCKAAIPVLFLITGQMNCIDKKPEPEPQKIACAFARVPRLTTEQKAAVPRPVRRYMLKNENRLDANNCPK